MADNDYIIENKSKKDTAIAIAKSVGVVAVLSFAAAGIGSIVANSVWSKFIKPRLDK